MPWVPSDQKIASMRASYRRHLDYAREYSRATRTLRKELGLCMRCGKEYAEPGRVNRRLPVMGQSITFRIYWPQTKQKTGIIELDSAAIAFFAMTVQKPCRAAL